MKPVKSDVNFPDLETQILKFWKDKSITQKGLQANQGKEPFVFYDGPPFATGLPHYGHILPGTLKDIVPRYWVMKGRYVERRWGWDCHGLPVEFEMEKELGLSGRPEVEAYGVAQFNEACRGIVKRYTNEWQQIIERTGRWVDFENAYFTMGTNYMESVWWVFKQLWDKGMIFQGHRVMPYSWRVSTPLSNFEAGLNYKEVQDPAVTVKFQSQKDKNRFFLAWTTTPWTLPSNLGLAVHPDVDYVEVKDLESQQVYLMAQARLGHYFKDESGYELLKTLKGSALAGEKYEPLLPYFSGHSNAFQLFAAEYVTTEDGTGIVHLAPAFGEDDFQVCQNNQVELVDPVDADGRFTDQVPEFKGQFVKDADKGIIKLLKEKGSVLRHETITHNYPFCWRSDTPLIYKAISTWFVRLEEIKERLVENNKTTHWVPEHIRDGRFGKWLENARDWNISRNRYWGAPLPVWVCDKCSQMQCLGSITELNEITGKTFTDIHKHFVDDVTWSCDKCDGSMRRVSEVLDCWFESGSMPYGQAHYPFENKEIFEKNFPAEFIAEGLDQTRGWFYTLSVLANALFDKPAFKNVIVNGMVLAEDGKKMSKRLKNYPDPSHILDTYGADALRAYLTTSPASHAQDLRFSETGVKEVIRSVLLPFWNAYSFFVTYALADGWDPKQFDESQVGSLENELDRWLVSRLQSLIQRVDEKMEVYHLYEVVPEVVKFIDELTNWYIRLNRRRFWSKEDSPDKAQAYGTLYFVLNGFNKVLAPVLPFITEEIHQNLTEGCSAAESVHLSSFPSVNPKWIDTALENEMELVSSVVVLGRTARNTNKLKTRQPLAEILIITKNPEDKKTIEKYEKLIASELNVKKVSFSSEESKWVSLSAKADAKQLGKKLGKKMQPVMKFLRSLSPEQVIAIEKNGGIEAEGVWVEATEILIDRVPKQEGAIQTAGSTTVWLDSKLNEELVMEGQAREFVNRVQKLRKELDFDVTDQISLTYTCPDALNAAVLKHQDYILSEVLASNLNMKSDAGWQTEQKVDGHVLKLHLVVESKS